MLQAWQIVIKLDPVTVTPLFFTSGLLENCFLPKLWHFWLKCLEKEMLLWFAEMESLTFGDTDIGSTFWPTSTSPPTTLTSDILWNITLCSSNQKHKHNIYNTFKPHSLNELLQNEAYWDTAVVTFQHIYSKHKSLLIFIIIQNNWTQ